LVDRLETVIAKLEAALARRTAENARLRRVELAAKATLADLDALIDEAETPKDRRQGNRQAG
jgi:hypothetical protein